MLFEWQVKRLKNQWGLKDSLEQYCIAHLKDAQTGWDWYLLNLSPNQEIAWSIVSGVDLEICEVDMEILFDINFMCFDGIKLDETFIPKRAGNIWEEVKKKRFLLKM